MTESTTLYCYVHPTRETALRCNNCERPICAQCAVRTPTGYRCKECVRERQKTFETAEWYDFVFGFIIAAVLSAIAAFLVTLIGGIGFLLTFSVQRTGRLLFSGLIGNSDALGTARPEPTPNSPPRDSE